MARLTTIRLYGVLGARFGRVHKLAVQTSAEAVKALCINLDGLETYLMNAKKNGMTFAVFRGKRNVGIEDFKDLAGDSDIRIAPVMEGAKKAGMFQTILGAVMIVAGVVIGAMTNWTGVGLTFGAGLVMSGASMMAGGLYQMRHNQRGYRAAMIQIINLLMHLAERSTPLQWATPSPFFTEKKKSAVPSSVQG